MQIVTILIFSLISGFIAAIASFLIFYAEYIHHFVDKQKTFKVALRGAIISFIVFAMIIFIALLFLPMTIL